MPIQCQSNANPLIFRYLPIINTNLGMSPIFLFLFFFHESGV